MVAFERPWSIHRSRLSWTSKYSSIASSKATSSLIYSYKQYLSANTVCIAASPLNGRYRVCRDTAKLVYRYTKEWLHD